MATLKQSTTYTRAFLVVQTADHLSGLTGASPTVNISKAGAAFGAAAGTVTEIANGWYKVALTTADTGTLGDLAFHITATSGDATDFVDQVTANILGDTLPANLTQVNAHSVTDTTSGVPDVNVKNFGTTAVTGRDIGASVLLSSGTGTGQVSLSSGTVTIGTNNDKTGYRLLTEIRNGTAQAGAAGSITLDASASATDNLYNGQWVTITSGTGAGQTRLITGYTGSTQVATVAPNWTTNPSSSSVFTILAAGKVSGVTLADTLTTYTGNTVQTGDAYARLGAPAGASVSADVAAVKSDTGNIAAVKTQTDKLAFTVANQIDANVLDWKSATAPAMTGDAFARLGAPAGASVSADVAAVKSDLDAGVTVATIAGTASNIKKNQALAEFVFLMTDSTNHNPLTGATVSGFRSIDGAAFAATATASATEIANGFYKIPLAAADLNGNVIALRFSCTGGDDQDVTIITQP